MNFSGTMTNDIYYLSEKQVSDLHRIVKESVNKILCERYLLESQQSNLGEFIQELDSIFDVKLHNYNSREKGRCVAYITTDTFDKNNKDFKSLMNKHQVFISSIDEFDAPDGTIQVSFESKYPEDVTKDVYCVQKCMGHSSPKVAGLYIRRQAEGDRMKASEIIINMVF